MATIYQNYPHCTYNWSLFGDYWHGLSADLAVSPTFICCHRTVILYYVPTNNIITMSLEAILCDRFTIDEKPTNWTISTDLYVSRESVAWKKNFYNKPKKKHSFRLFNLEKFIFLSLHPYLIMFNAKKNFSTLWTELSVKRKEFTRTLLRRDNNRTQTISFQQLFSSPFAFGSAELPMSE